MAIRMPEADGDPMLPRPRRLRSIRPETGDVATLELEPAPEDPAHRPGQFNMLYAFGVGEVPISIATGGTRGRGLVHTIRTVGKVTRALNALEPGMRLGLRGPFGSAWPLDACAGRDVLVVAGGIGLAPLYGAIEAVLAEPGRFGRLALLVGGRSPDMLIYTDKLDEWLASDALQLELTVDHAGPDWPHDVGVVTELLPRARIDPANTVALLCGPEVMMRFAAVGIRDLGVPEGHIHVTMERNMKCAIGHCGHCQLGPKYVCKDGPVFPWPAVRDLVLEGEV